MCGIFGGITKLSIDRTDLTKRLNTLEHRGPDQCDLYTETINGKQIFLGQTRLNIVDHNSIELPVKFGNYIILFNGEIYNYLSLKRELTKLGWNFLTATDTEVALAAYIEWGVDCLNRFNGMWAIAIWDGHKLFLCRDRLGQKPLFYRFTGSSIEFASEIKALSNLEYSANEQVDLFEFCYDDQTPFKNVFSVKPGYYFFYDSHSATLSSKCYWNIDEYTTGHIDQANKAVDTLIDLLSDSISLRMQADAPIAMFLSGGIDSALIAKLSGIQTAITCQFSEFENEINEEQYAVDLAQRLGIRTHVIRPTRSEFFDSLPKLAYHLEVPTGSFSAFPLYALSKATSAIEHRVVLTGEGSDELFAGYVRNEFLLADQLSPTSLKETQYLQMIARYHGSDLERFCRMASRTGIQGAARLSSHLHSAWNNRLTFAQNITKLETIIYLQPLLQMSDRMTMAHSIESRCPFLDYRIVEFSRSISDQLMYKNGTGKWLVHKAAQKILPRNSLVLERPVKHGLPTPINLWLYGHHGFDRSHWNTKLMNECINQLCPTYSQ